MLEVRGLNAYSKKFLLNKWDGIKNDQEYLKDYKEWDDVLDNIVKSEPKIEKAAGLMEKNMALCSDFQKISDKAFAFLDSKYAIAEAEYKEAYKEALRNSTNLKEDNNLKKKACIVLACAQVRIDWLERKGKFLDLLINRGEEFNKLLYSGEQGKLLEGIQKKISEKYRLRRPIDPKESLEGQEYAEIAYLFLPERPYSVEVKEGYKSNSGGKRRVSFEGDADSEVAALQSIENAIRRYQLPKNVKPCIASMLDTELICSREEVSFVLAIEFRRLGTSQESAEKILLDWNTRKANPPLRMKKITDTVKFAYRKKIYFYGCEHPLLASFCQIDKSHCMFYLEQMQRSKGNDRMFFKHKYQHILHSTARQVYWMGIREVEKERNLWFGATMCIDYREISAKCGVTLASMGSALTELEQYGLIKLKIGKPGRFSNIASEISRVAPVPKPPLLEKDILKNIVKKSEQH